MNQQESKEGKLIKGLLAVEALISESDGVSGLHLNGDDATWDSLRTGGYFEEWLLDFDIALQSIGSRCKGCNGVGQIGDTSCDKCKGEGVVFTEGAR